MSNIRQQAFNAMLSHAVLRWESLVTLVLTAILFLFVKDPFPWWQDWFWLVGGAVAEAALVISTLTDPNATQEAVSRQFESKYDINEVKSRVSRERIKAALEYRRNMMKLAKQHHGAMRVSLQQTIEDVNNWIAYMYDLAKHIDAFDSNELAERDRQQVPRQIEKARIRLDKETNPAVRAEIEKQIAQLEQQKVNLDAMFDSGKRAEIQLESTLSSLGTIYAQMSVLGTKEVDSARAQRLRLEIQDEVASLQDTIEAMDEVQAQRLRLT